MYTESGGIAHEQVFSFGVGFLIKRLHVMFSNFSLFYW